MITLKSAIQKQFVGPAALILPWLAEDGVSDILINGTTSMFVEKLGNLQAVPNPFLNQESLQDLIERMLLPVGKRMDAAHPYADGRLLDGSRFHIILPPVALEGPLISIRRKRKREDIGLEAFGSSEIVKFLTTQVELERNILIAGGTGVGKTTLLSLLIELVNPQHRLAVVEETTEIEARHPHLIHLEARPPSPEGQGEVSVRTLVKNALRMRPDRLVVGECRGEEAFDMLQAMNTGHRGSLGTIHASSALDALKRLESLVLLAGFSIPIRVAREWIAAGIHTVVYLERRSGERQIAEMLTVNGLEGDVYRITPRFKLA